MRTHNIFGKIGGILAEINEQYQYLSQSAENINELELELLSANADFLAEHIKVLKKSVLASAPPHSESESIVERLSHSNEYRESMTPEANVHPYAENLIKQEFPEAYSSFHKPIEYEVPAYNEEESKEVESEDHDAQAEAHAEHSIEAAAPNDGAAFNPFSSPEAHPPMEQSYSGSGAVSPLPQQMGIAQQFEQYQQAPTTAQITEVTEKVPTLNEVMSAQRQQASPLSQYGKQPVADLKSIISLNDKLLFIKDLFNGYSLAYSEAIEIINRFDSFDAADNFLKSNYSSKNNWASKQATADKFYELLNRRFAR